MILHHLITPRGWISSAKMYSLVIANGELLMLHTGAAASPDNLFHPMTRYRIAAELIQGAYDKKNVPEEKAIDQGHYQTLAESMKFRHL